MTRYLNWDEEKFNVGHPELNRQHKSIVNLLNQLIKADAGSDANISEIGMGLVKQLILDLGEHLDLEEELMTINCYPYLEDHKSYHYKILDDLSDICISYSSGQVCKGREVTNRLKNWFINHILEEDMKYKPFIEKLIVN